jgi:hypothetical protein
MKCPSRMHLFRLALTATSSACLVANIFAQNPTYELTKYLDVGTQVPGAAPGVLFTSFDSECPSLQDRVLCFQGDFNDPGTGATEGIFTVDVCGTVTTIVFNTDLAPGGGTLEFVRDEMLSGARVAWRVQPNDAIYARNANGSGPLTTIVDTNSIVPGTTDSFTGFYEFGMDGDLVIFQGDDGAGVRGVYTKNLVTDTLSVYAITSTTSPFPGAAATLSGFGEPMVRDGRFACNAGDSNGTRGLLTDFGAGIVGPVNSTVQSPSGLGNFSSFDEASIDGDRVAFQTKTSGNDKFSVYMYDHSTGTFSTIADETIPRPGGGFFDGFNGNPSLSIANGITTVIFETGDTVTGLWAWIDGTIVQIVREGDILDGKTVNEVSFDFPYGIEGTKTAFRASFTDGTWALYFAELEVPECVLQPLGAENFCTGAVNSSGTGATLSMGGSSSVATNDFTLTVTGVPVQSSGMFVYDSNTAQAPYGDGLRCVGTSNTGLYRLSPTLLPNGCGIITHLVDLTSGAPAAGSSQIDSGSTWYFQFLYRDSASTGAGFNASDGLKVIFCP